MTRNIYRLCLWALLSYSSVVTGQIPGKKTTGPVTVGGVELRENDTLSLGTGAAPYGGFKFIYQPTNLLAGVGQQPLPNNWNGRKLAVKFFKVEESKKFGRKVWVVVAPAVYNYVVDFEAAVAAGEVLAVNGRQVMNKTTAASSSGAPSSVADELLKLKQLLDAGAITQAEYDQQKKKVLER